MQEYYSVFATLTWLGKKIRVSLYRDRCTSSLCLLRERHLIFSRGKDICAMLDEKLCISFSVVYRLTCKRPFLSVEATEEMQAAVKRVADGIHFDDKRQGNSTQDIHE